MEQHIHVPFVAEELADLRAGDTVMLSGVIYTSRDKAHKRMVETLDRGEALPVDWHDQLIYYAGPTPARPGHWLHRADDLKPHGRVCVTSHG